MWARIRRRAAHVFRPALHEAFIPQTRFAGNPAKGVLNFVVTLTTAKDVRSYPCRTVESAIKLAERFIAGVSRQSQATADVTKLARQSEPAPPPAAEPVAA